MVKDHSYWIGRGVSESTIKSFNGGVVLSGKMKDRYVFPIKNYKKQIVGFSGKIFFDKTKLDGTPRKLLHIGLMSNLGWKASTSLSDGLRSAYREFQHTN